MAQKIVLEDDGERTELKVHDWAFFEARRHASRGEGRAEAFEAFVKAIPEGMAVEYPIPEDMKEESARTAILSAAKRLGVPLQTTRVGMPEGILLVGKPRQKAA